MKYPLSFSNVSSEAGPDAFGDFRQYYAGLIGTDDRQLSVGIRAYFEKSKL